MKPLLRPTQLNSQPSSPLPGCRTRSHHHDQSQRYPSYPLPARSAASARKLCLLPQSASERTGKIDEQIAKLLKHSLIEERETSDQKATYRTDGDIRFSLFITNAGLAALNISDDAGSGTEWVSVAPLRLPAHPN